MTSSILRFVGMVGLILSFTLCERLPGAPSDRERSDATKAAVASLRADVASFSLDLSYHGPARKMTQSATVALRVNANANAQQQRISEQEAFAIIELMADDGFFHRASINAEKLNKLPREPFYTLSVGRGKASEMFFEHYRLDDQAAKARIARLADLVDGEAKKRLHAVRFGDDDR